MNSEAMRRFPGRTTKHIAVGVLANAHGWPRSPNPETPHHYAANPDPKDEAFDYVEAFLQYMNFLHRGA